MPHQFPPLHIVTFACPFRIARPPELAALLQRNNPGGCRIRATVAPALHTKEGGGGKPAPALVGVNPPANSGATY